MEKLTENMIRWAESKLGSTEYALRCLAFIEDALGLCMGLLMGITFGLFDSDKGGKEDE